jgi:uncharacterized FlgJ-related protein
MYDSKQLAYKRVNSWYFIIPLSLCIISLAIAYGIGAYKNVVDLTPLEKEILILTLEREDEVVFYENDLIKLIKDLNLKFPEIVYAQAVLETGNFKSEVFLHNNNLFGMKVATIRPTTALGVNLNHAYYSDYKQSVYDYAFYQSYYLKDIKNQDDYLKYLGRSYAEDSLYVNKLKRIIQKNKNRF